MQTASAIIALSTLTSVLMFIIIQLIDISTTVFSYTHAVQYHAILHGMGVIAQALGLCGTLATTMCFN